MDEQELGQLVSKYWSGDLPTNIDELQADNQRMATELNRLFMRNGRYALALQRILKWVEGEPVNEGFVRGVIHEMEDTTP